jgi:hypothetical protein
VDYINGNGEPHYTVFSGSEPAEGDTEVKARALAFTQAFSALGREVVSIQRIEIISHEVAVPMTAVRRMPLRSVGN